MGRASSWTLVALDTADAIGPRPVYRHRQLPVAKARRRDSKRPDYYLLAGNEPSIRFPSLGAALEAVGAIVATRGRPAPSEPPVTPTRAWPRVSARRPSSRPGV